MKSKSLLDLCLSSIIIILLISNNVLTKRSSGKSRSSSSSGTSFWNRKKSSSSQAQASPPSGSYPKQEVHQVKPSAPVESNIRKDHVGTQQASNTNAQSRPIGWDVPGQNQHQNSGWKSGYQSPATNNNPTSNQQGGWKSGYQTNTAQQSHVASNNAFQTHGSNPGYNANGGAPYQGHQSQGGYPGYNTQGGHPGYQSGYPGNQAPSGGYPGYQSPHGAYPGNQPYHGGYPGYQSPHGGYPGYPQSPGGWGNSPNMGGYSNNNWGGGSGGMMGGMGGFGGGGYGYPMQKKSGFFSGSTFRNVLAGMVVWHLVSGLVKKPYTVHNYYNQPADQKVEEIKLPSNILTLCDGNATSLCTAHTTAICTTNGTILCVTTMSEAVPCSQDKTSTLCVNTTVPCVDENDPLCKNSTNPKEASVSVPCYTNLTVDRNILNETQVGNQANTYCVTTMAIAGPDYKACQEFGNSTNDYRSVLNKNYTWYLEFDGFRRPYIIHNYEHPIDASGEINMPLNVLVSCPDKATKLCAPNTTPTCTTFNEVMCLTSKISSDICEGESLKNTTCIKSTVSCIDKDTFCNDTSKQVELELPCFANITLNANTPNFDLMTFNGSLPITANSSYTYHYNYCVVTLGIPGPETGLCAVVNGDVKKE